eukprot:gb/GEZJ01001273.1/.p2 GENE.gb/GEZJ01001273.1/~~gb/GEZJ01001273.1/.p2  ORF type:complete len:229 (-),score=30.25 gb/GEZJ01001273.1/:1288-1974(-)
MSPIVKSDSTESGNYAQHDIHRLVMTAPAVHQRVKAYGQWAPNYDEDVFKMNYSGYLTAVDRLKDQILKEECCLGKKVLRILDAGCGTGLCGTQLELLSHKHDIRFHIIGVDSSEDMLALAKKRNIYNELLVMDLNCPFSIQEFDYCVASGVFLEGHCKADALRNILEVLRPGGSASISIRHKHFVADEEAYREAIRKSHCEIVKNDVLEYLTETLANYMVIRKTKSA